jgi:hypothetical protein
VQNKLQLSSSKRQVICYWFMCGRTLYNIEIGVRWSTMWHFHPPWLSQVDQTFCHAKCHAKPNQKHLCFSQLIVQMTLVIFLITM